MTDISSIPTPSSFILHTPLYEEFTILGEEIWNVIALKYFKGTIDYFCPECNRDATFKGVAQNPPSEHTRNKKRELQKKGTGIIVHLPALNPGIFEVVLQCTRNINHNHSYIFLIKITHTSLENKKLLIIRTITKIGQYPSFSDLNISNVIKYKTVLDKKLIGELSRAIGLASHDVGIGAYVYLRRIFESLIEDAHQNAKSLEGWDEELYKKSRVLERIKILKELLPEFLVDNPSMYALLSKGVHELTERECLDHFDTLKIGIELILDQKIEKAEKEIKIKQAKSALIKAGDIVNDTKA